MTKKVTMIDPPTGWRYGFPRAIPPEINFNDEQALKKWLVEVGYPEEEVEFALTYSRYWKQEIE